MPTHKENLRELSLNQLSDLTGKTFRTIKRRLEDVEPKRKDGRTVLYESTEALEAIYEVDGGRDDDDDTINLTQERAKLARRQTEKLEIEIEIMRKKLLPADVVERVWGDMIAAYRARTLAIEPRVAQALGLNADQTLQLKDLIHEALAELADYDPDHYDAEPGSKNSEVDSTTA